MNVGEIALRVKRQFGDEAGAQITDADIIRWVNDAQREIAHNNDLLQATATTAVVNGQDQYALPPDTLTLRSVRYAGRKLSFFTQEEASTWADSSTAVTGSPTHYSTWGLKIDLYPAPVGSDPDDIQIYYTRQPATVTLTSDTPELPLQYHNRIVEYCIAQAHELDDNMESYDKKMSMFQDGVDRLKGTDMAEQDTYAHITTSPSDTGYGYEAFYG